MLRATGGRYWKPSDLKNLPRDISYSEAGISVRSTKELWDMPIVFLLLLGLPDRGVAAAPQVGCGMKRAVSALCSGDCSLRAALLQARAATYYVIVSGLGGEPDYVQRFTAEANDLDRIFKAEGPSAHVTTLTGAQATAVQLRRCWPRSPSKPLPNDDFVLILIGHGSFDGVDYKFNLVGPDMTATEIAALCDRIASHAPARRRYHQFQRRSQSRHSSARDAPSSPPPNPAQKRTPLSSRAIGSRRSRTLRRYRQK